MTDIGKTQERLAARPLTVLAVDDEALVRMNTVAMLEDLGHRVIEASNGQEALDALHANPGIGMVVTDYAMPHMTGGQLAIAIERERPNLPVIIATGYAELPGGEPLRVGRLPKPFGMDELEQAIAAALKR